jgi:hypothetical protein
LALDHALGIWRSSDRRARVRSHWFDLALIVVSPPLVVPAELWGSTRSQHRPPRSPVRPEHGSGSGRPS